MNHFHLWHFRPDSRAFLSAENLFFHYAGRILLDNLIESLQIGCLVLEVLVLLLRALFSFLRSSLLTFLGIASSGWCQSQLSILPSHPFSFAYQHNCPVRMLSLLRSTSSSRLCVAGHAPSQSCWCSFRSHIRGSTAPWIPLCSGCISLSHPSPSVTFFQSGGTFCVT